MTKNNYTRKIWINNQIYKMSRVKWTETKQNKAN